MDTIIGYIFDQPGGKYKDKYYFPDTAENMIKFILQNNCYDVVITDCADNCLCKSTDGVISISAEPKKLEYELIPKYYELKTNTFTPLVFEEVEERVMKICEKQEGTRNDKNESRISK